MRTLSATVLAPAFTGCTMIPHYTRPDAPVAPNFPGGSDYASDAADIRWRDFFTDPRLKRLVELALPRWRLIPWSNNYQRGSPPPAALRKAAGFMRLANPGSKGLQAA